MNFLEELVAEWLEFSGYLVSQNVRYGTPPGGGYLGECDVLGFLPQTGEYIHVEVSGAASRRDDLIARLHEQFDKAKEFYRTLMPGGSGEIQRLAVARWAGEAVDLGQGIESKTIQEFVQEVCERLAELNPLNRAVPQKFPLLRAMQYAIHVYSGIP